MVLLLTLKKLILDSYTFVVTKFRLFILKVKNYILRILQVCLKITDTVGIQLRRCGVILENFITSLVSLILFYFLSQPHIQAKLTDVSALSDIFIGIGSLIGTIIALVLTISLLPIQRSVEVFTPTLTRMCKEDGLSRAIIVTISLFGLFSFIASTGQIIDRPLVSLFPYEIVLLGVTFDLIRWYHRRTASLLDPIEAINMLSQEIEKFIKKCAKWVKLNATIQWLALSSTQRKTIPVSTFEKQIYLNFPQQPQLLNTWTKELTEISIKAISRNETYTAKHAINVISGTACFYLITRKDNISVKPESFYWVLGSDTHAVLDPIYEGLDSINKIAIRDKSDTISIAVAAAYQSIALQLIRLQSPAFKGHTPQILWKPLQYLTSVVTSSQAGGLYDVPINASRIYYQIAVELLKDSSWESMSAIKTLISGWEVITIGFNQSNKYVFINEPITDMMKLTMVTIQECSSIQERIVDDILLSLERIMSTIFPNEKAFQDLFSHFPGDVIYNPTYPTSLYRLSQLLATRIKFDDEMEQPDTNYNDFININRRMYQHLRILSSKFGISNSFLFISITQCIYDISLLYLELIQKAMLSRLRYIDELEDQASWYLSFFWSSYTKSTAVNIVYTQEAINVISKVGLHYLSKQLTKVPTDCISNIFSIGNSYYRVSPSNMYEVVGIIMKAYYIQLYATKLGYQTVSEEYNKRLEAFKMAIGEEAKAFTEMYHSAIRRIEKDIVYTALESPTYMDDALQLLSFLLDEYNSRNHNDF